MITFNCVPYMNSGTEIFHGTTVLRMPNIALKHFPCRLLMCEGRAVFLLSPRQHEALSQLTRDKTKPSTSTYPTGMHVVVYLCGILSRSLIRGRGFVYIMFDPCNLCETYLWKVDQWHE